MDAVIEVAPETGLQHEAVSRAAEQLRTRTDEEAKNLKAILASVKPITPMTEEEALENLAAISGVITCALALKMFDAICASGNLPPCLVTLPDQLKPLSATHQKEAYIALAHTIEKVDLALGENVDQWSLEASGATPIRILRETPAPAPAPAELATA